ncbi:MAG: M56 family metallopeptidase [Verrucomicrobiota bacterium]
MSISSTYLLNAALHAVILSIFASLVLMVLRQAKHRSIASIAGLLAVGFLAWLTALRPAPTKIAAVPEIQTQARVLPTWTVAIMPAMMDHPTYIQPGEAPAKFVSPDPLTSCIMIWATGSGIGIFLLGIALLKVRRWRKSLRLPDNTAWQNLHNLAPETPTRGHFRISESAASPCVTGFWQPKIVIPRFLLGNDSEKELRWAVRHEIAHWQAGDSRWMILFAVVRGVNWWNPLVHRLVSQWSDARELLCDLHATGVSENREDYGKFLVVMAGKINKQPPLAVSMAKRLHAVRMKRRIVFLLAATAGSESPVGKGFVGVGSAVFFGCAVLVSVLKIGAEEPPDKSISDVHMDDSDQEHSLILKTINWAVSSNKKSNLINNEVIQSHDFMNFIENSKQQGWKVSRSAHIGHAFGDSFQVQIVQTKNKSLDSPSSFIPEQLDFFRNNVTIQMGGVIDSDHVILESHSVYRFIKGNGYLNPDRDIEPPSDWNDVKSQIMTRSGNAKARLKSGEIICTDLGEVESGVFLQVFTQVFPSYVFKESESGKFNDFELGSFSEVVKIPSKNVRGKLRLTGIIIDVPIDLVKNMGLGSSNGFSLWGTLRNVPDAKRRELASVEFPLNEVQAPWPELPGLEFSATASDDFKYLNLLGMPAHDAVVQESRKFEMLRSRTSINFKLKSDDPHTERRVFFIVEVVP